MATQTTNLKLVKPAANENVDIDVINGNMDIIDTKIGQMSETPVSNFMGRGTRYKYQSVNGGDANDITYEFHGFVFNMLNISSKTNYCFLDVSVADGSGFAPTNAKPIIRQVLTDYYYPNDVRVRIKRGDSDWTSWMQL